VTAGSSPPEKGSPACESGAKGLANLPNSYQQRPGEQLVFSAHGDRVCIKPCPESGKGVHDWIPHAARKLAMAGVDPSEAENWIRAHMTRTPSPSNEVATTINKIYREQAQQGAPDGKLSGGVEKPEFCPNKLEAIAAHMDGVDAEWLAARSPIRVDECTPASFLHALFSTGEKVLVFSVYGSQGQVLWTHPGLPCDECALDRFRTGGPDGVWFLSNPCDGCFRSIPRLISENNPTGRSRRAEENLTDFRHLLIESDMVEPDLWLAALVQ
jgi:hypothetical protein